jgi:uroporphyrinogen-III decarboxylase
MNLSPEAYAQFIRPMDQRILDEFGGGQIHFCGRGDHFIEAMCQMNGLSAIAMSQPHLNDMEKIYRNTVDKGIKLLMFNGKAAKSAGRPLRGQVHSE